MTENNIEERWKREQEKLREDVILVDDFSWTISDDDCNMTTMTASSSALETRNSVRRNQITTSGLLRFIGGVDLSFGLQDPNVACAALVVLDISTLEVVYESFECVLLTEPYIPGFLAFRECPSQLALIQRLINDSPEFAPQVLLVDGNGLLHPRGFGSACHLGILSNIPTIGVSKKMTVADGLTPESVKEEIKKKEPLRHSAIPLVGCSGSLLGAALFSGESRKPIFVSTGHRISLETALRVVKKCCKFRIPEPIRHADLKSRDYIRRHNL